MSFEGQCLEAVNLARAENGRRAKCGQSKPGYYCTRLSGHPKEHHWHERGGVQ